jgi:hypothetical protein
MNVTLWIIAGLLAAAFLAGGAVKVAWPKEKLVGAGMGFAGDFSAGAVKAVGALEMLAAVGLILPAALGIAPVLVPLAAAGLGLLMTGAMIIHLRRGETQPVAVNVVILALAVLVAWQRFGPQSFSS